MKSYKNMTPEEIKEQLEWSDQHEFSYGYSIWAFKEIERLNNIINELEKELDRGYRDLFEHELVPGRELITNIKNYLQELKGSE